MLSQESYNYNNNNHNSSHTPFHEMTDREKALVMGNKGIGLPTQMMIKSESAFFRRQQHCLAAAASKKSSSSQSGYASKTVWRTFIVSMSIIFAAAILMYLLVIFLFSSETKKCSRHYDDDDRFRDRFEFDAKSDYEKRELSSKCPKNGLREILEFYLTDVRIHAFTPIVFYTGMHEAFMARDFVNVS